MTYVFVFGGLLLLLGSVVVLSLLRGGGGAAPGDPDAEEEEFRRLPPEARREAALDALREVEFEYGTGKLPEEDYRALRRRWGRMALEAREATGAEAAGGSQGAEADIGAAPCPRCGQDTKAEARFCGRCGAALGTGAEAGA